MIDPEDRRLKLHIQIGRANDPARLSVRHAWKIAWRAVRGGFDHVGCMMIGPCADAAEEAIRARDGEKEEGSWW